jgi:hypothetical protein
MLKNIVNTTSKLPFQSLYFTTKALKKGQITEQPNLTTLNLEKASR